MAFLLSFGLENGLEKKLISYHIDKGYSFFGYLGGQKSTNS